LLSLHRWYSAVLGACERFVILDHRATMCMDDLLFSEAAP
jgi:hypothetical protein